MLHRICTVSLFILLGFLLLPAPGFACENACCSSVSGSGHAVKSCCCKASGAEKHVAGDCGKKNKHASCSCTVMQVVTVITEENTSALRKPESALLHHVSFFMAGALLNGFYTAWFLPKIG